MGSGLRKPAHEEIYSTPARSSPRNHADPATTTTTTTAGSVDQRAEALDEQLDRQEELKAKRDEENAQRQKAAVDHVVENLYPYAPVKVQTQRYPPSSPHAGKAYLWVSLDEDAIKRRGGGASPIRYPVGVAIDAEGNVFVTDSAGATTPSPLPGGESPTTRKILATSIMELAVSNSVPPVLPAPRLVQAQQDSLVVRWKKSTDTTVDRYELQFRAADHPHAAWSALSVVFTARDVALEGVSCHQPYEFRVRAHNPAGWSEFSQPSEVMWTLPGVPSTPRPPVAGTLTNTYISLFWSPADANGAPPVVYSLEMRDCEQPQSQPHQGAKKAAAYVPIYEGTACSFVASALRANASYTFRVQASNTIGSTLFVESKPIKTLAHGRPEIVELVSAEEKSAACDRWVQCWDPKTEQVFFFNKYTCQRVTEEPREITERREKQGVQTVEETPEMLFRRKRFRFHRDLRQALQGLQGVNLSATMSVALHRETMFEDTLAFFSKLSKAELFAKAKISFVDEAGIDSGGLTKDWYLQISKLAVSSKTRRLFKECDRGQYEIHPSSSRCLVEFRFLGKFMAKAIFDRQNLDLPLCDAVLKYVLQLPVGMDDLQDMDLQFHKSLLWMLENDISGVIDEMFSVEVEGATGGGKPSVEDLKENGRDIPVTNINKAEYVQLMLQWRTQYGVKAQLDALVQGFSAVVPLSAIKVFDLGEVRLLLNGKPTIDVEELRANTVFQGGYSEHTQVVLWLWQALREFSFELRGLFLKFMTGTNKVPLDGFDPPLNLTKSDLDPLSLPRTHTCFNQIVLPEYTNYETLVDKLTFAITNADGFELS